MAIILQNNLNHGLVSKEILYARIVFVDLKFNKILPSLVFVEQHQQLTKQTK